MRPSFREAALAATVCLLSACGGTGPLQLGAVDPNDAATATQLGLRGGSVVATGPEGYCVDTSSSRARAGFALFAACNALITDGPAPARQSVISVQASAAGTAGVSDPGTAFSDFLRSASGAAVLSQTGQASDVSVDRVFAADGAVIVVFVDKGESVPTGMQARQWRAFTDINDHLVTVQLRGLDQAALTQNQGVTVVRQAIRALRQANGLNP